MKQCEDIRSRLALYLDQELQGDERARFETHLQSCKACRMLVANEQLLLEVVRQARPLHQASPELRARVERLISETTAPPAAPAALKRSAQSVLLQFAPKRSRMIKVGSIAVAAGLAILLLPALAWMIVTRSNVSPAYTPSNFALMAAETHLRHTRGQLPLEINSDKPQQISEWFANKVDFSVKLPNYQESSGQEKLYTLEGARLVGYQGDYAAYVAYQMKNRPISLVITASGIVASGGEEITARGLTFHYDGIRGLKVITWSDGGLTYALVSDLEERGQQSCVVCHQGAKDQDFISPLKPKR